MAWLPKFRTTLTSSFSSQLQQPCCKLSVSAATNRQFKVRTLARIREFTLEERAHIRARVARVKEQRKPYDECVARLRVQFGEELQRKRELALSDTGVVMQLERKERLERLQRMGLVAKSNEELALQRQREAEREAESMRERMRAEEEEERARVEHLRAANTGIVLQMIEDSKDFITFENIDEKIEEALTGDITSHNFAVTPTWEKIHSTKPPGNMDGWKGAPPMAYIAADIDQNSDEWNEAFEGVDPGFTDLSVTSLRRGGIFPRANYRKQGGNNDILNYERPPRRSRESDDILDVMPKAIKPVNAPHKR